MDYIKDMLLEIKKMADGKNAHFLTYLIEMALIEVDDQIYSKPRARRPSSAGRPSDA